MEFTVYIFDEKLNTIIDMAEFNNEDAISCYISYWRAQIGSIGDCSAMLINNIESTFERFVI